MKKSLVLIAILAFFAFYGMNAQVYKTVRVDTAGTLSTLLSAEELDSVTNLTLTGKINSDDFGTMKNGMPALTSIDLESVQTEGDSIPGYAFSAGITSLILPSSLTRIGNNAIRGCGLLATIIIPSGVRSIGDWAFTYCAGLNLVTLPESLTSIGSYAFAGCSSLPSIQLPDSVTFIGRQAFVACTAMKTISIPPLVTTLVDHAFEGCSGLDSISLGTSITSIGTYAFAGCSNLKSIVIPVFRNFDWIIRICWLSCIKFSGPSCLHQKLPSGNMPSWEMQAWLP